MANPGRVAIVGYPVIPEAGRDWIERVRGRHDPQAVRIRAHFTLVFPCVTRWDDIAADMTSAADTCQPIGFRIVDVRAVPDAVGSGAHVFLVPDEQARQQLVALHDRLYSGTLKRHLRGDIRYVPHITVAGHQNLAWCQKLAGEWKQMVQAIDGRIDAIELIDVGVTPVAPLRVCALTGVI